MIPEDRKYRKTHEWIKAENGEVMIGITDYAQEQLGDIVLVELPELSRSFDRGEEMVVIESVKAASDVYAPLSGRVTAVNGALLENPELVNQDPFGEGWLLRLELSDATQLDDLLSAEQYQAEQE